MTGRATTHTYHAESVPPQPVAQVADPAVRAIMLARRRALLLEAAEIARRCGLADKADAGAAPAARTT